MNQTLVYAFAYLAVACRKARELEPRPDESDDDWKFLMGLFERR